VKEVLDYLVVRPAGVYVDGTVGTGGHSQAIAAKLSAPGRLICMDRDLEAVQVSESRLAPLGEKVRVVRASYSRLGTVLRELGLAEVDGVLLDLGMSSHQLEQSGRGFSFNRDEPLDMRMDSRDETTAAHLINRMSSRELASLLRRFGEERRAKAIAGAIARAREKAPIETSGELARLVRSVFPRSRRFGAVDPATRTFQALRIAVNRELHHLRLFMERIPDLLKSGGRLAILTYHSLEDRLVKQSFTGWERGCTCPPDFPECVCGKRPLFRRVLKKGLKPSREEIEENPRARSAQLRVAERLSS
jgi:16S rRNA (cytosine1402-N4)-methyltransferase